MKRIGFYEAVDVYGTWYGTATLDAIKKAGLIADGFVGYEPESVAVNGWACSAKATSFDPPSTGLFRPPVA